MDEIARFIHNTAAQDDSIPKSVVAEYDIRIAVIRELSKLKQAISPILKRWLTRVGMLELRLPLDRETPRPARPN
jgi:hypothetical protein